MAVLYQPNQQNHLSQFTSELCSCRNNFPTRAYAKQRMDTSLWVSFFSGRRVFYTQAWTLCHTKKKMCGVAQMFTQTYEKIIKISCGCVTVTIYCVVVTNHQGVTRVAAHDHIVQA